jgi:hypothetical protein
MSVNELTSSSTGKWIVTSQGSRHIFDLDNFTYKRIPGDLSQNFSYDSEEVKLSSIKVYPKVSSSFYIFFDDLDFPDSLEHWRISSTIVSIDKYEPTS